MGRFGDWESIEEWFGGLAGERKKDDQEEGRGGEKRGRKGKREKRAIIEQAND